MNKKAKFFFITSISWLPKSEENHSIYWSNHNINSQLTNEGILQVALFTSLWFKWSVRKLCLAKVLLAICDALIWTLIPIDLVTNLLLFIFYNFLENKNQNHVFSKLVVWSGTRSFFFLFWSIVSHTLFQNHAELNRLLSNNFHTCYSCSNFSSMVNSTLLIRVDFLHVCVKFMQLMFGSFS